MGNYAQLMQHILMDANATFTVLLMSLIAAVLSLVRWVLMAMRQAGLLVLAAMLPRRSSRPQRSRWTSRELRHSFVSLLSDDGVPIEQIARLVGHADGSAVTETV